jgi:V/A-type H+/Na+-transporting ATPase subunit C
MDSTTKYAAINTKVRVLEGRLLKDDDYIKLLSKKSVSEVALYLKENTHYKDILDKINENEMHRGRLENLLKGNHINGLGKIVHYFYGVYKKFYRTLFIKFEIEDMKVILRSIKTDRDNALTKDLFIYLGRVTEINLDTLISSKSFAEFIRNLKGSVYYNYLRSFIEKGENINLFSIETTLDLAYFDLLYKSIESIESYDIDIIEFTEGTIIDLLNLQWVYRGLKFYSLSPEELFNYTITHGREFTRNDIKDLCYSKSLEDFQKKILSTKFSFLFDNENTRDIFMERRILRYQYFNIINALKRKSGMNISRVIIYTLLIDMEVRDIISIIENIRYGMPAEEAKKFLIRKL